MRTLSAYFLWHYSRGVAEFAELWRNLLVFFLHFFSIPLLLRTLIAPWKRMGEATRGPGFHPEAFFGDLIVNILLRIVGLVVRLPTILVGLSALLLFLVAFPVAFIVWLLLPLLVLLLFICGLWFAILGI